MEVMRTTAWLALATLATTCGPSPNAMLPGMYIEGTGGTEMPGSGGSVVPPGSGASGGVVGGGVGGAYLPGGSGAGGRIAVDGGLGRGGAAAVGGRLGRGGATATTTIAKPTCSDRLKNQDETDVDCGGAICVTRCFAGMRCLVATDCATATPPLACDATTLKCVDPCKDEKKDGDETGVDCGGSCPLKCVGEPCTENAQCQSMDCDVAKGTCKAPTHPLSNIKQTCWDGITGFNPSDKTVAKSSIVPCMTTNGCCKLPRSTCTETCFVSNDGTCGVNKTGGGMGPHSFILAYYQKCVP